MTDEKHATPLIPVNFSSEIICEKLRQSLSSSFTSPYSEESRISAIYRLSMPRTYLFSVPFLPVFSNFPISVSIWRLKDFVESRSVTPKAVAAVPPAFATEKKSRSRKSVTESSKFVFLRSTIALKPSSVKLPSASKKLTSSTISLFLSRLTVMGGAMILSPLPAVRAVP